jgi:hypothetical protein
MKTVRGMLALFGALGVIAAVALPAGAGGQANMLTIEKVVVGPAPASATFTVHVDCQPTFTGGKFQPISVDVVFDSTGTVTSANDLILVPSDWECVAHEAITGGATTTGYACDPSGVRAFCDQDATSATASFEDTSQGVAVITVTNTFPDPPIVPIMPAVEVVVAPAFTG